MRDPARIARVARTALIGLVLVAVPAAAALRLFPGGGDRADSAPRLPEAPRAEMGRRSHSALVNAPGYVPPADPESLAVARGRRDAGPTDQQFLFAKSSAEELAGSVLEAVRRADVTALKRLRVTYEEFRDILWPEFPQSRPVTNISADEAWRHLESKTNAGMRRAIADIGGREFALRRLEFSIGREEYTNFRLFRGVEIHAATDAGSDTLIDFAATFAERNGRWKVLAYED